MTVLKWFSGASSAPKPRAGAHSNLGSSSDDSTASTASLASTLVSVPTRLAHKEHLPVSIHPVDDNQGLIVKVQPPVAPPASIQTGPRRTPCDIVLVIDVSSSMSQRAPAPDDADQTKEDYGLSVLDLTKHAALTILETLDERDRLGIVTYSSTVTVVQRLTVMKPGNKKKSRRNIEDMEATSATNMWQGIVEGLKLCEESPSGRVPAVMVLTDGMPNCMCPRIGYVPKLREMGKLSASIHTFGFGYSLRSGLLKSIAEFGGGNYAFIPDAGMIGTVFVHAVANLQSTFATNASLRISYPSRLQLEEMSNYPTSEKPPVAEEDSTYEDFAVEKGVNEKEQETTRELCIPLGSVQYGQSRDFYFSLSSTTTKATNLSEAAEITATLDFHPVSGTPQSLHATSYLGSSVSSLTDAEADYHKSRAQLCRFLSSLYTLSDKEELKPMLVVSDEKKTELSHLIRSIPARNHDDAQNKSLLQDLDGPAPKGQVTLATTNDEYWRKWGDHYLLSLLNAHHKQICNSFKDPGPLQYGTQSPLFIACRDRLDKAFDLIPPPKPTAVNREGKVYTGRVSMSRYHNSSNPCFAGSAAVRLASGKRVPVRSLRRGAVVATPAGARKVAAVLVTPVRGEVMCRVGELLVTPWHPVSADGGKTWVFPAQAAQSAVRYTGCIYSVLLQPDRDSAAHAVHVGGMWGVTLGHGVVGGGADIRAHEFFGSYTSVARSLRKLGVRANGLVVGGGTRRDEKNGMVCGFRSGGRGVRC